MEMLIIILLGIVIGLILLFLLHRWFWGKVGVQRNWLKNLLAFFGTLISVPLFMGLIYFIYFSSIYYYPDRPFHEVEWESKPEKRYELSADLVENSLLIGKSKEEIDILLGEPSKRSDLDGDSKWTYDLGRTPSMWYGYRRMTYLVLSFNGNFVEKVTDTSQNY